MTIFQTYDYICSFYEDSKRLFFNKTIYYYKNVSKGVEIFSSLLTDDIINYSFCSNIFNLNKDINFIKFTKIIGSENISKLKKRIIKKTKDDDNILVLPDSYEVYLNSFGKKTRMHLRQYKRHFDAFIIKNNSKFEFSILSYSKENEEKFRFLFDEVYRLNQERCISKGFYSGADKRWWNAAKSNGVIISYMINGKVIACTLSTIINNQLFLHMIAHDNAYGDYNVGNLVLLDTVKYAIEKHINKFHFLWGACEYKTRFGAVSYPLYDVILFKKYRTYFFYKLIGSLKNLKDFIYKILRFPYRCLRKIYRILKKTFFPTKIYGITFMLHRVDEWGEDKLFSNENMKITPDKLQDTIDLLKKTHNIISSTQITDYIKSKNKKPFAVFTMDDGYIDNYTKAYPIFKNNNVPFTIFLTTDFPEKKAILWWYVLEDLILASDSITLSNGKNYSCKNRQEKEKAFLDIRLEILALEQTDLLNELNTLFSNYNINWLSRTNELCMSWDDIDQLKNDPLVTIGGHTKHHYNLKALSNKNAVIKEVTEGIDILKKHGIVPEVFAYPFGSSNEVSKREIKVLSMMGFKNSFLAYGEDTTNINSKNVFSLPRKFLAMDTNI